jgi:hypothetical protein
MMKKTQYFWFVLVLLISAAICLQYILPINPDITWLAEVAKRFLAGGSYQQNYFEINPPLIIYFYLLPTWIANTLGISCELAIDTFSFLISFLVIAYLYYLSRFYWEKKSNRQLFVIIIVIALLICSADAFNQRSYYAVALILPYLFQSALLVNKKSLTTSHRIVIGILTGIAVSFKPYYLLVPLFIEVYLVWQARRLTHLFRLETICMSMVVILYLATIPLISPTYFSSILPFIVKYYLAIEPKSSPLLLVNLSTVFAGVTLILWGLYTTFVKRSRLLNIFVCAMFAFFLSYYLQKELWFYHLYPIVALATIVLFWITHQCLQRKKYLLLTFGLIIIIANIFLFIAGEITPSRRYIVSKHSRYHKLIQYTKKNAAKKSIYCFVSDTLCTSVLLQYADVNIASRFSSLWMLPGMLIKQHQKLTPNQRQQFNNDKDSVRKMVAQDFHRQAPTLVFVYVGKTPLVFYSRYHINYLQFLLQDPKFKKIWSRYHYQKNIGNFDIYRLRER